MSESGWFQQHFLPRAGALLLGALCVLAYSTSSHAVAFDADVALTHDDNVTRAQRDEDILKDEFLAIGVGASHLQWLSTNHRMVYRGFLRGEKYNEVDGLTNASIGGQVTYQYRASGQFTSPTYAAFFKAAMNEFDSDMRDSNLYTLGVSLRKPVTDRITVFTSLSGNRRDSDSTAFDTNELSLIGNVDYSLGRGWTLYLTYNYLDGDIVSSINTSAYGALPLINTLLSVSDAVNVDDAFQNGTWFVYRLDAKTNVVTLGTNVGVGEHHSFDFSARWIDSDAAGGISYKRRQVTLAYLVRF